MVISNTASHAAHHAATLAAFCFRFFRRALPSRHPPPSPPRLPRHIVDLGIHIVGCADHLGVRFIRALRQDHLHELGHHIDIRVFEIPLLQCPQAPGPPGLASTGSPDESVVVKRFAPSLANPPD